jgi:parallel beta-helix repeat protein
MKLAELYRKMLILLILLTLGILPLTFNVQLVKADGTVSGTVAELDSETPIVGALVEALQQGDIVASSATTVAGGVYSLSLPVGPYKMRASAANYITSIRSVVNVTSETVIVNFNLSIGHMLVFDDFTGSEVDTSRWNSHVTGLGYISIGNATDTTGFSVVNLASGYGGPGSAAITSKLQATLGSTIVFEGRISAYSEGHWYPGVYGDKQPRGLRAETDPNNAIEFISYARDTIEARTVASGVATTTQYVLPPGVKVERTSEWDLIYKIEANSTLVRFYVNDFLIATHTTNIPTGPLNIYMATSYDGYGNVPASADYLYMTEVVPNRTWIVDDDGPADFQKIQEAIDAASDGDTISVRAGIYYEKVIVDKSVSLVGEDRETTIVYGNGTQYALSIWAQHVSLAGFAVTNATAGIRIETSNCTISNVKVFGTYVGIWTYESAYCVISDSLIINQTIHHGEWEDFGGWGIFLESSWFYDINRNIFENIESAGVAIMGVYVLVKNNTFNDTGVGVIARARASTVVQNQIENSSWGIYLSDSLDNSISGNSITNGDYAIEIDASSNNTVSGNSITNNEYGICLNSSSNYNSISGNNITNPYGTGISLDQSSENTLSQNNIANNTDGILLSYSSDNTISGNNITSNYDGIWLITSSNNTIYHNNLFNNTNQVGFWAESLENVWDNGYPSGGNYWSDYNGIDLFSGPYQNETGSDGIGDTMYVIDANNTDHYPLVKPFPCIHAIAAESAAASRTVVGQGFTTNLSIDVVNRGHFEENLAVTVEVFVNGNPKPAIWYYEVRVASGSSSMAAFVWDTSEFADGNYTLKASVEPVPNETDTTDNTCCSWIVITVPGDINGDFTVDIYDALTLAGAYNSKPNSSNWNLNVDINGDNIVDIYDAIILAGNFNKRVP